MIRYPAVGSLRFVQVLSSLGVGLLFGTPAFAADHAAPAKVAAEAGKPAEAAGAASGEPGKAKPKLGSLLAGFSVDNFLGFNVHFTGGIPLADGVDLLLLGTIFTAPQFGDNSAPVTLPDGTTKAPQNNAFGLFVPVGPGLKLSFFEKKLAVIPFLEVANGGLLSGQRFNPDMKRHTGALAEGLVPGLSIGFKHAGVSVSAKGAYFAPIQNLGPHRISLARIQGALAYRALPLLTVGLMYDWLTVTNKTDTPDFKRYDDFMFVGPQLDFHLSERAALSLAAGPDFAWTAPGDANHGRTFYRVGFHTEL